MEGKRSCKSGTEKKEVWNYFLQKNELKVDSLLAVILAIKIRIFAIKHFGDEFRFMLLELIELICENEKWP